MNNKEYISLLASELGYTQTATQRLVTAVIDALGDTFQDGKNVAVGGFGTFEVKKKMERVITNPATQQRMLVPPKLVLGFKPAAEWRSKLKGE